MPSGGGPLVCREIWSLLTLRVESVP